MIYRDVVGQSLRAGDTVLFSLGLGVTAVGIVHKADEVISPNAPPMIHVNLSVPLPAGPNGVIGGITKLNQPTSQITEA